MAIGASRREGGQDAAAGCPRPHHPLFAALYDVLTAPLERTVLGPRRAQLLTDLEGEVLEVGAGTGLTLRHYRYATRVVAAEPDAAMRARMTAKLRLAPAPVEIADATAEALPYPDASFDAVVFACALCTVRDHDGALAEAGRVLRPAGRLVVLEHVRAEGALGRWQDHLTPLWSRLAAGCHLNRDTRTAIERAGFAFGHVESFDPFPRWVPTRPMMAAMASLSSRTSSARR